MALVQVIQKPGEADHPVMLAQLVVNNPGATALFCVFALCCFFGERRGKDVCFLGTWISPVFMNGTTCTMICAELVLARAGNEI